MSKLITKTAKVIVRLGEWKLYGVIFIFMVVYGLLEAQITSHFSSQRPIKGHEGDALSQWIWASALFSALLAIVVMENAKRIVRDSERPEEVDPKP